MGVHDFYANYLQAFGSFGPDRALHGDGDRTRSEPHLTRLPTHRWRSGRSADPALALLPSGPDAAEAYGEAHGR